MTSVHRLVVTRTAASSRLVGASPIQHMNVRIPKTLSIFIETNPTVDTFHSTKRL
jgi:hypothetical protein